MNNFKTFMNFNRKLNTSQGEKSGFQEVYTPAQHSGTPVITAFRSQKRPSKG